MDKNILLKKYASGMLSQEENAELEQLIERGEIGLEELEGIEIMSEALSMPNNWSSSRMDERFQSTLEDYTTSLKKQDSEKSKISWLKYLLPAILIALAFVGGFYINNTVNEESKDFGRKPATQYASAELTETLMNTHDVAEKINLVSTTKITDDTDGKVIQALLFALNNDPSSNVRIACIEALYAYANLPLVRQGFIQAISAQSSPIVLARLADAINKGGQLSKEEFRDKLNKDLPEPLLESMEASLINI